MPQTPDFKMDATGIYREDVYSDRKVGTIRVLTPVQSDGSPDTTRTSLYLGDTQILTPMGALPVSFDIEATSLAEAIAKFGEAAEQGVERTVKELQEMRRQAASSIVVPPAGSIPGSGKIQLP
jgi:hypothetical protein